ncbi:MAG: 1,2-phenylacetyl-CoA epoxidase subunit PaaC [Pseudomonadales bacterium]
MDDVISTEQSALLQFALAEADDALIFGQRLTEWSYSAPYLEEDLALSNVALDYLGRANNYYEFASTLDPAGRTVDQLAMMRDSREFTNLLIHELPVGDFAFTMARQFILDCFYIEYLAALQHSSNERIAAISAKSIKEAEYHVRRSREWILRLGDGTDESHTRVQNGFDELWGYTPELFLQSSAEAQLLDSGVSIDRSQLKPAWDARIDSVLSEATLSRPDVSWQVSGGREGIHTETHGYLVAEMQHLQRAYPGLQW